MKKKFSYPDVSVVVVNYNGKKYLEKCLSSLRRLDYKKEKLQIILVDNCSTDGSSSFIKKHFPEVRLLRNDINNYAKANNIGIKSSDGEFVALLNNDTYVDKNWLSELLNVTKKHQRIGCAGSKVLFPDGRIQSAGHYEFPNFYWGDRGLREPDLGQYDFSEEVSSLSGTSVLFRRKCLEEVGFLDEDFVMYLEDVDLFLRCRNKEWKLVYAPKSIVYHEFHGTADDKLVNYYIERNRLLLIAKHFPEKLSDALIGKGYFAQDKNAVRHNEIYSILPEVFTKLLNVHGRKTMHILMPGIFENLKKLENLKNDSAIQFLNNEQENLKNIIQEKDSQKARIEESYRQESAALSAKNQELSERSSRLENEIKEISGQKTRIEESYRQESAALSVENQELSERSSRLENRLKDIELKSQLLDQDLKTTNNLISNKDAEIANYKNSINRLESDINRIYDSQTYRFIVRPLWNFLDMLKPRSRGFKSAASHILRSLLLLAIVFLFSVFIVIPLKIKKFFKF